MKLEILLIIGGVFHIAFAVFHLLFWKLFKWESQLAKLHPINKAAMQAMNIALIVIFLFFAYLSFFLQDELKSELGIYILGFISFFWLVRTIVQFNLFKNDNFKKSLFFGTCNALFIIYGFATSHLVKTL